MKEIKGVLGNARWNGTGARERDKDRNRDRDSARGNKLSPQPKKEEPQVSIRVESG